METISFKGDFEIAPIEKVIAEIEKDGSTFEKKSVLIKKFGQNTVSHYLNNQMLKQKWNGETYYVGSSTSYDYEEKGAMRVGKFSKTLQASLSIKDVYEAIVDIEEENGFALDVMQKSAISCSCLNGLSYITGIPGSGKTTVLNSVIKALIKLGVISRKSEVLFLAPTGKASDRMKESVGAEACTIDHALKKYTKFPHKVIVVDESSMMDLTQLTTLMSKAEMCQKMILLGDIFQLASVGNGNCLKAFVESKKISGVKLHKCFRQDANAKNLISAISEIMNGTYEFSKGEDFVPVENPKGDRIELLVKTYLEERGKVGEENLALLLPFREAGTVNSNNLNKEIKKRLFGENVGEFVIGERVMQNVNRVEVKNGEIGKVTDRSETKVIVRFQNGSEVTYPISLARNELNTAYAYSIHKAQGSEYHTVVMAVFDEHKKSCSKNLIYTGVTRAKKKCILFYDTSAIEYSGKIETSSVRVSMLSNFIDDEI